MLSLEIAPDLARNIGSKMNLNQFLGEQYFPSIFHETAQEVIEVSRALLQLNRCSSSKNPLQPRKRFSPWDLSLFWVPGAASFYSENLLYESAPHIDLISKKITLSLFFGNT